MRSDIGTGRGSRSGIGTSRGISSLHRALLGINCSLYLRKHSIGTFLCRLGIAYGILQPVQLLGRFARIVARPLCCGARLALNPLGLLALGLGRIGLRLSLFAGTRRFI